MPIKLLLFAVLIVRLTATVPDAAEKYGPAAAIAFARSYRGDVYQPNDAVCYPNAVGVPFADCENIIPMAADLWTPAQLAADFRRRMAALPAEARKRGIIVLLKSERCAPKAMRACTTTTAALEKRATPLVGQFLIYGVWLLPRDHDDPPGSLPIESGANSWKNEAAGQYQFKQGPGATLVFLDPRDGAVLDRRNAIQLHLVEQQFLKDEGRAPVLEARLEAVLDRL